MRCGTIGSRQSAAISEIVKRCWSTHVSGAIASVQTFTFTFKLMYPQYTLCSKKWDPHNFEYIVQL